MVLVPGSGPAWWVKKNRDADLFDALKLGCAGDLAGPVPEVAWDGGDAHCTGPWASVWQRGFGLRRLHTPSGSPLRVRQRIGPCPRLPMGQCARVPDSRAALVVPEVLQVGSGYWGQGRGRGPGGVLNAGALGP